MRYSLFFIVFVLFFRTVEAQDGVSIGLPSPDPSAVLHVDAPGDDKGMLIPRLTTLERNNIQTTTTPANGLIIYNTDQLAFNYYDGSGWVRLIPTPAKFNIDMGGYRITNMVDGINPNDAASKRQVDNVDANNLDLDGTDPMNGVLVMNGNRVIRMADGINETDAVTKGQLDAGLESIIIPELFTTTGGSSNFVGGVRWTIIDTGNSDRKQVDITAWSDVAGGLIRIQVRSGATRPANSESNNLLIQRNFQPSVGAPTVSQESIEFGVNNTTDRYFHIRVQPENGATIGFYGLKVRVKKL